MPLRSVLRSPLPTALLATVLATALAAPAAAQGPPPLPPPGRTAWLGVSYDVGWLQRGEDCEPRVFVEGVVQGSPAERAGLRPGDVIVALDGEASPAAGLGALAGRLSVGDSVRLRVDRDGRTREITAVADRRPSRPPALAPRPFGGSESRGFEAVVRLHGDTLVARNLESLLRGGPGYWLATDDGRTEYRRLASSDHTELDRRVVTLVRCADSPVWRSSHRAAHVDVREVRARADSLRRAIARRMLEHYPGHPAPGSRGVAGAEMTPLEPELAEYFRNAREGLLVLRVSPGTVSERAGLRPGDVILRGNGSRLASIAELRTIVGRLDGAPVELQVVRKGRTRTLTLQPR